MTFLNSFFSSGLMPNGLLDLLIYLPINVINICNPKELLENVPSHLIAALLTSFERAIPLNFCTAKRKQFPR